MGELIKFPTGESHTQPNRPPKPRRHYPIKAITEELASRLNQEVGRDLSGSTLLEALYNTWAIDSYPKPREPWPKPPEQWTQAIKGLEPRLKGGISGALKSALESHLVIVEQLRIPLDELLVADVDWTFGRARMEFLHGVFATQPKDS